MDKALSTFKQVKFESEDAVLMDSSFMLGLTGNSNPKIKRECAEFIQRAEEHNVLLYSSVVAQQETSNVIMKNEFKRFGFLGQENIKQLRTQDPQKYDHIHGQGMNSIKNFTKSFRDMDIVSDLVLEMDDQTMNETYRMMEEYKIFGTNDAMQLVIAMQYGIPYFATLDKDFVNLSIPGLGIVVDSKTYESAFK